LSVLNAGPRWRRQIGAMPLSVDIHFRDQPRSPLVEAAMRERLEQLAGRFSGMVGARIVVDTESNRFLTDHDYIVMATVRFDDGPVIAGEHQRHPDLASAVECTFATLERRLQQHAATPSQPVPHTRPDD
jgi:ribosome-associated translation inhibitor RaiA